MNTKSLVQHASKWILLSTLFIACSPRPDLQKINWTSGQSEKSLAPLNAINQTSSQELKSASESITIQDQLVGSAIVENSFIKILKNNKNEKILIEAAIASDIEKSSLVSLQDYEAQRAIFNDELKARIPAFRLLKIQKTDLVIAKTKETYEPLWRMNYFDKNGTPWEIRFTNQYQVRSLKRVGSQFHDTFAIVFPKGPKVSALQEVSLKGLALTPTISNNYASVQSQSSQQITDLNEPLRFNPGDARFDQVQVFYFLTESLKWFEAQFGLRLPYQLQADVHVGAPDRTNTAFYYQGKIRIGAGDQVSYQNIPQDPSIVIHESAHALIESVARLPYEGEGGSLNEAFADFFTALQLDNPRMGEVAWMKGPFRRTIDSNKKLSERTGGLYGDSAIVSGTLWELRKKFGIGKAKELAILTLNRLNPMSDFTEFGQKLNEVLPLVLTATEQKEAIELLKERGWLGEV